MTLRLGYTIPDNVVEIGNEVAQGMIDALNAADNPTGSNPLLTKSAGDAAYLEKDGGGTVVGTVVVDTDGTVGGNTATITGTSVEVNNFGVGTISIDPVLGITFPDSTSQGTAAVTTPDATTSVKGKVQLATIDEAIAGTNTTKAVTPEIVYETRDLNLYGEYNVASANWSTATSGGAFVGQQRLNRFINTFTAIGYGTLYLDCTSTVRGSIATNAINWSKKVTFTCRVSHGTLPISANTFHRIQIGKSFSSGVAGDLTVRGIGIRLSNGALTAIAHNGTTLSTNATSYTPSANSIYDLKIYSDGNGTVTIYVNGISVGTVTGGPTTTGSVNENGLFIESQNTAIVTTGAQLYTTNPKISFGV